MDQTNSLEKINKERICHRCDKFSYTLGWVVCGLSGAFELKEFREADLPEECPMKLEHLLLSK